jgi:hypothetical protein
MGQEKQQPRYVPWRSSSCLIQWPRVTLPSTRQRPTPLAFVLRPSLSIAYSASCRSDGASFHPGSNRREEGALSIAG